MKQRITSLMMGAAVLTAALPAYAQEAAPVAGAESTDVATILANVTQEELQQKIAAGEFDVNSCDKDKNSALLIATVNRRSDLAYVLLSNGADVNYEKESGITPLTIACLYDDWVMADLLITHGANVNYSAANGESTLSLACAQGALSAAQLLLMNKANPNAADARGLTPLLHAILHRVEGSVEIVRLLLEYEADANAGTPTGFTPLMAAAQNNDTQAAEALLEHGAKVNALQTNGSAALSIAVALGHTEMVELLLSHKADVQVGINPNTSLLAYASMLARADMMELLLSHGANGSTRDAASQSTPLHITATGNELIADSLKLMGAADLLGAHEAKMDAPAACRALLKHGAEVDAVDKNGTTPLMIAAMDGSVETLAVLLEYKANINAADAAGRTPLIQAVLTPEAKAAISLKDVSPKVAEKIRPTVIKSMTEYPDVLGTVRLLLENGADVHAKDKAGKTALDYAENAEVRKLLEAAAAK